MKQILSFCLMAFSLSLFGQEFFINVTEHTGIEHIHVAPNLMGGGVAVLDFDNDGFEDLYLTGGVYQDKLYRNLGNKTFEDVTSEAGIFASTRSVMTQAVNVADINNDGFTDVFVCTGDGYANLLFLNNGDGTFQDISEQAGFNSTEWSMGSAFGDFNLDGYIDIYVTNYIKTPEPLIDDNGVMYGFAHECYMDKLYINKGNNTFTDYTSEMYATNSGCGLAVASTDINQDGNLDIYIANDFGEWIVPNTSLMNNYPDTGFTNKEEQFGMDMKLYAMGIATGDVNNDGLQDYYITNLGANALLVQDMDGVFHNNAFDAGVENDSINSNNSTGWGTEFFDYNHDGYEDLIVSNGYIGSADFLKTSSHDPNKLFKNNGDNTFEDVSELEHLSDSSISRGLATIDYDNDGDLDLLIVNVTATANEDSNVLFYENTRGNEQNWLKVKLKGTANNRNGIGARVITYADNNVWIDEIGGGGSHASKKSSFAHFGVSNIAILDSIKIIWPGNKVQKFNDVATNQYLLIDEDATTYNIIGCTNENSQNYNASATINEGCIENIETILSTEKKQSPFIVFPNPAHNVLYIEPLRQTRSLEDVYIVIEDITGKQVLNQKSTGSNLKIDISGLAKGIYYLRLQEMNKPLIIEQLFVK